jgi:AcrR family transcriptional regulator
MISRDVLERFRRERVFLAVAELAHEEGPSALTMSRIVKQGRMSRNTFYALFADKAECLDLACEFARDRLLAPVREVGPDAGTSQERLARAISGLVEAVSSEPTVAELCMVHAPSIASGGRDVGVEALVEALIATMRNDAREEGDEGSAGLEEFVAATIASIVVTRVRRGEAAELAALQGELTALAARLWSEPAERVGAP